MRKGVTFNADNADNSDIQFFLNRFFCFFNLVSNLHRYFLLLL